MARNSNYTEFADWREMREDQYMEIAAAGEDALIRVHGLGDMHLAPTFDDLSIMLAKDGCRHLAIDLGECTGMDSTFMGTLISINVRYSDEGCWMCLVNVNAENQSLLKMLGVWGMVQVKEEFTLCPVKLAKIRPPAEDFAEKRLHIITLAHERLVQLSKENSERFGPFLDSLRKEINQ